ncbi:APC family permease [Chakrabartyella piscis]|uniref:APC family permease n=1 Tax=Chakrabartyella piscis TaxID=2918914 RepID=UPI002958AC48|nr:amino acid permease [Chakrabartyella piscis]
MSNNNQEMKKNLGLATAMATVVGCVIGSGVFFKPQAIYTATGGAPGLGMLAWLITGLVCIAAAMTFAEVAIMIPKTGGMVVYLEEAFGKKVGFLAGWMQSVLFYPAMIAALAVIFAEQASLFVGEGMALPLAVAAIVFAMVLNCLGSAVGGAAQIIFTICKLIPLILLMVFGFIKGSGANPIFTPMVAEGLSPAVVLGQLMIAVLFAFEGWTNVGAIAGEMKDPGKDLPIAIVGGVSMIMAVYFVINLAYIWVLPADQLMNMAAPASAVAIAIFGEVGGKFISIGIMISVLGAANGFILSGSRVTYSLAAEGTLPASKTLAKLNGTATPINSIIAIGSLAAVYAASGQFNRLTDLAVFACWIFYTLTFIAVMRLRKTMPDVERKYKVPCYPVIPMIAIVSGIYVVINQLFMSGSTTRILAIGSIILTLIGLPIFNYTTKKMK